jgi:hypothetical protein
MTYNNRDKTIFRLTEIIHRQSGRLYNEEVYISVLNGI